MRMLILILLLSQPAYSGWFSDRAARKAQIEAERERMRIAAEHMRRRLWREKQWSKVVDGLKDHLAKGRFKYLVIGFMSGAMVTAGGIWYFCHDGCRFFNPPDEPQRYWPNPNPKKKEQNND